jgi:glycogen debranching enzyme
MPELICGFDRSAFGAPVRYPVACSPQAWAATSWSALAQAMFGLQADAVAHELRIARPRLPKWLTWVDVHRVPVGSGEVDLRYEQHGDHTAVDVVAMRGNVRVAFTSQWSNED